MPDIEKYLVRNQKKILTYLKLLLKERCLISASFGKDHKATFLTAIIDIDKEKQRLTLDCGPKEYLNKRLLNSASIKCRTKYQGIDVIFEGKQIKKSGVPGQPAFSIPIPGSIFWVQRRQFYRVKSPLSYNSYCILSYKENDSAEEKTIQLKLNDLSASGISILNESTELSKKLLPAAIFNNCKLVLESENNLKLDLEIRHKRAQNHNQPGKIDIIGCYIINPTPRLESTLLRYMHHIESEIKLKSK